MAQSTDTINSILRATELLKLLAQSETHALGVLELTRLTGLHRTTVFRILKSLEAAGWVEQEHQNGKYRLGFPILQVASAVVRDYDYRRLISEEMHRLCALHNENVVLGSLVNGDGACIDLVKSNHSLVLTSAAGYPIPLGRGATGKILLAHQEDGFIRDLIDRRGLDQSAAQALWEAVCAAREQGWSSSRAEVDAGVSAVAVPVYDASGAFLYVLGMAGAQSRIEGIGLERLRDSLLEASARITGNMRLLQGFGT